MLTIYEDQCFLCNDGCDTESFCIFGFRQYYVHLDCWKIYSGKDDLIDFDSYDEWVNFAGLKWDFKVRCVEYCDKTKEWYVENNLHRENGPAIEWADGSKSWYINDKHHREDGPSVEHSSGLKDYHIDGKYLTETEFNERMK